MTTLTKLSAYGGDAGLKAALLAEVGKHRALDHLVQRTGYGDKDLPVPEFKGCAVGCSLRSLNAIRGTQHCCSDHEALAKELQVPIYLAYLQDYLFEWLPAEQAMAWPEKFYAAIQPGADLSRVPGKFLGWSLADKEHGFNAIFKNEADRAVVIRFGEVIIKLTIDENTVTDEEWDTVRTQFLASLARLDRLDSLASLARLDRLDSLARLARLASLDRLDRLASLASLASLARLASLASLASLTVVYSEKLLALMAECPGENLKSEI